MPFSDINKAIQLLEEGKSLRCVLHFWWREFALFSLQKINVDSFFNQSVSCNMCISAVL
jgi:hypothetical protein